MQQFYKFIALVAMLACGTALAASLQPPLAPGADGLTPEQRHQLAQQAQEHREKTQALHEKMQREIGAKHLQEELQQDQQK